MKPPLHITERIRLRAFGTSPKCPLGELQIRSERYAKSTFDLPAFVECYGLKAMIFRDISVLRTIINDIC